MFLLLSSDSIAIIVYVHDLRIRSNKAQIGEMVSMRRKLFVSLDLRRRNHFLGFKITFPVVEVFLSQTSYIQKVVQMDKIADT